MVAQAELSFAGLLRQLRAAARLTQEELAEAAGLSPRSVSDLERGVNRTARKDTALLLAGALGLAGRVGELFVMAARGKIPPADVLEARGGAAPRAAAAAATRGLPRDVASFTGRQAELDQLMRTSAAAVDGVTMVVCAIGGMAGVGKTTFAVHAAHRLAHRFPDGQFFLSLRARTHGQPPVDPADALVSLLLITGVAAAQIAPGLDARAVQWRDQVAGKRILLLLDDAAGHEQVRPLLPGTGGSLVLVTSRRRLIALEDSAVLTLEALAPDEAAALLVRLAARTGMSPADAPVAELTRLCGHLPLAIGMLARQLRHHPAWTVASVVTSLTRARNRLAAMHAENLSVAAAFELSYQDLDPVQQRLFRRLGLVPGATFDAYAAAALDGTSLDTASRQLEELYDHHLIIEPKPGRYLMHDLVREHAGALAAQDDPSDTGAAIGRLLNYYVHAAAAAGRHFVSWPQAHGAGPPGRPPPDVPDLSTLHLASAWLETERPNLHAAVDHPAFAHLSQAAQIPPAISGFLRARGYWDESASLQQAALTAACRADDRPGQAHALIELGILRAMAGNSAAAVATFTRALTMCRDLDDRPSQAAALSELGFTHVLAGDYAAGIDCLRQALTLARGLGDPTGQADVLNHLGIAQKLTGDYASAAASQREALALYGQVQDRLGEAWALDQLGDVQQLTGDYAGAAASRRESLALFHDFGDRLGQARVLNNLGQLAARTGDISQARRYHQQALTIAREIDSPVEQARAREGLGQVDPGA